MSGVKNFMSVLYHSVFPEKAAQCNQELPRVSDPVKNTYNLSPYTPLEKFGSAAKYMSEQFNKYCSEAGVSCTVTMDPSDYAQLYYFKNYGDRVVRIDHNRDKISFLKPGEAVYIKVHMRFHEDPTFLIPRVTPLNNGV